MISPVSSTESVVWVTYASFVVLALAAQQLGLGLADIGRERAQRVVVRLDGKQPIRDRAGRGEEGRSGVDGAGN